MSHEIDMTTGKAGIAFLGSRRDVWHRLGTEMPEGASIEEWSKAAGLGWRAIKVPAIASLEGPQFDHIDAAKRFLPIPDRSFLVRNDTGGWLGFVSGEEEKNGYQSVQPDDVLDFFAKKIEVDDRFRLDVAGSLDGGRRIWATALYDGDISVAGENHQARVLMSTSFDGTMATINQCTMTRVVCSNTLRMALYDNKAAIKTRHNTRFDAAKVSRELGQLAQGFATYKKIGDALVQVEMAKEQVSKFFKECLDIPWDAKQEDVSTRKQNQFADLSRCYRTSVTEGAQQGSAWAALQAITRYADHSRSVKINGQGTEEVARFNSATFGSGDALKGKAMQLLMPLIKDRELVPVS